MQAVFSWFANQFRDMDPIIEQFRADYDMNPHGTFATTYDRKQTLLKLNHIACAVIEVALTATALADPNENWNVAAIQVVTVSSTSLVNRTSAPALQTV